jgi:hypothetical protein
MLNKQNKVEFSDIEIGRVFTLNGCMFEKKSSRTAYLASVNGYGYRRQSLWFYVGKSERCYIESGVK